MQYSRRDKALLASGISPVRWPKRLGLSGGKARILAVLLAYAALCGTGLATLISFAAPYSTLAEVATHFKVFYLLASVFALLLFAITRLPIPLAMGLLLALFHGAGIIPFYFHGKTAAGGTTVSILSVNVLASVGHADREHFHFPSRARNFLDYVERTKPDLVFLQEIHPPWIEALAPLRTSHPHYFEHPRDDNYGIALYSRFPLEDVGSFSLSNGGYPAIKATVTIEDQSIALLNVHTMGPFPPGAARLRNRQFRGIARHVQSTPGLSIVAGDINTSMWSPYYTTLIKESGLKDARKGFGILPTWLTRRPIIGIVPLDYCFVSPEIAVTSCSTGPKFGSDHLPLMVELVLPAPAL